MQRCNKAVGTEVISLIGGRVGNASRRRFVNSGRIRVMSVKTREIYVLETPKANLFSHINPGDTPWKGGGLRDFFLYRDLGVAAATGGRVIAHLVKANAAPEAGTGWHHHDAEFHIVLMLKGWAKFMYEDKEHVVSAGDCVHQRPGIVHFLFDYSEDMEYLEVVGPADFPSIDDVGPCAVPSPAPWVKKD